MVARWRPRREGQRRWPGLRLGATGRAWASWDAWPGGLHPPAQRHVQGLLPLPTSATQMPNSIHPASSRRRRRPSCPRVAEPPLPRSSPRQSAAGGSRALGAARRRGDLQGSRAAAHLRPPPTAASALGTRRPPAVPARCAACAAPAGRRRGRLQASSPPTPVLRPRYFRELASPLAMEVGG